MNSDLLQQILARESADAGTSGAWVSVLNQHKSNKEMRRSNRWHQRQVEAKLRTQGCELEPVEDEEDGMEPTLINCNFYGDKSVNAITKAVVDVETGQPTQPLPPANGTRPKWWRVVLATLAAVIIGGLLVFIVAQYFLDAGDDPAIYEIIATDEPFAAPEPFTGGN